jgi:APA family basic amino acid/polyamine antiporter
MVVVGGVIGSGVFLKPRKIAAALPSPEWIHGCWIVLGLVCLLGALCYAELGAMRPEAGGQYAFLRQSYGRFPAFLYGWCLFFVVNTGTLAALSMAFVDSLAKVVTLSTVAYWSVPVAMIVFLAAVNIVGVQCGAALQNVATFAKIAALAAVACAGFFGGSGPIGAATTAATGSGGASSDLLSGLALAGVAVFWAYEGWYQLPFNAAEMKQPERTLARGLIGGILILIALYVAANAAYLALVPQAEMAKLRSDVEVPRLALERAFGPGIAGALPLLICLSVFGAANPNFLSTPRAFYAMAKDRIVPAPLMAVHPRFRTPHVAILAQAAWAIVLIAVLRAFHDLTDYVVFVSLLFYALTALAVLVERVRRPDVARPFRCPWVPFTPILFAAVVLAVDVLTLVSPENRSNALIGLAILAAGVPVYFVGRARAP